MFWLRNKKNDFQITTHTGSCGMKLQCLYRVNLDTLYRLCHAIFILWHGCYNNCIYPLQEGNQLTLTLFTSALYRKLYAIFDHPLTWLSQQLYLPPLGRYIAYLNTLYRKCHAMFILWHGCYNNCIYPSGKVYSLPLHSVQKVSCNVHPLTWLLQQLFQPL